LLKGQTSLEVFSIFLVVGYGQGSQIFKDDCIYMTNIVYIWLVCYV